MVLVKERLGGYDDGFLLKNIVWNNGSSFSRVNIIWISCLFLVS